MKVHFYMVVGGEKPELECQAEVFIRSLDLFGKIHDYEITICTNKGDQIKSDFLKRKAEIISSNNKSNINPAWYSSLGCVPKKGDVTIYTDADMLVSGNLNYFIRTAYEQNSVCGVLAYGSPFDNQVGKDILRADQKIPWTDDHWKKLFKGVGLEEPRDKYTPVQSYYRKKYKFYTCPYYVNLGFVAVPTGYIGDLNKEVARFLVASDKVLPGHYHRPQFAMMLGIAALDLPRIAMPLWCNCPDSSPFLEPMKNSITAIHLLRTKSKITSWDSLRSHIFKLPPKSFIFNRLASVVLDQLNEEGLTPK